jgi:hypothetical protein
VKFALGLIITCFCFVGWCILFYKAGRELGQVEGYDKAMEDIKEGESKWMKD